MRQHRQPIDRFPIFRRALRSAGAQGVDVVCIGDSITEGYNGTSRYVDGYVGRMAAAYQADYGDGGFGFVPIYFNTGETTGHPYGWTLSGSWSAGNPSGNKFGPYNRTRWATGTGNTASITTPVCDTVEIHVTENAFTNGGTVAITVDGGSPTNFTMVISSSAYRYRVLSLTGLALTTHTVVVTAPATNYVFINGAHFKKGLGGVRFSNIGKNGQKAGDFGFDADEPKWIASLNPKLVILAYTTNDYAGQTALATYESQLDNILAAAKLTGADILCIGANPRDAGAQTIPQASYHNSMAKVAARYGAKMIDFLQLWISDANQIARGWASDHTHPTDAGHLEYRNSLRSFIGG